MMVNQNGWKYFYFSAFDEEWKIAKGSASELDTVEAHFGLYNSNRLLKDAFQTLKFTEDAPVTEGQKPDAVTNGTAANSSGNAANANGNAVTGTSTATPPLAGVNAANSTAINGNAATSSSNATSPPTGASTPAKCSTD